MNTSIRGHGKWGDFLVALIPLSWCGNILVNSNFILRMIEWQNEGSLFTLRVQGKQWYWVYKFDASAAQNILAAPKNIGHDRWFVSTPNESYCADSYYEALHMGSQLEYTQLYYKLLGDDQVKKDSVEDWRGKYNWTQFSNYVNQSAESTENIDLKKVTTQVTPTPVAVGYYDNELIDDTSKFMSNVVDNVKIKPLNILAGIINKHNMEIK